MDDRSSRMAYLMIVLSLSCSKLMNWYLIFENSRWRIITPISRNCWRSDDSWITMRPHMSNYPFLVFINLSMILFWSRSYPKITSRGISKRSVISSSFCILICPRPENPLKRPYFLTAATISTTNYRSRLSWPKLKFLNLAICTCSLTLNPCISSSSNAL